AAQPPQGEKREGPEQESARALAEERAAGAAPSTLADPTLTAPDRSDRPGLPPRGTGPQPAVRPGASPQPMGGPGTGPLPAVGSGTGPPPPRGHGTGTQPPAGHGTRPP